MFTWFFCNQKEKDKIIFKKKKLQSEKIKLKQLKLIQSYFLILNKPFWFKRLLLELDYFWKIKLNWQYINCQAVNVLPLWCLYISYILISWWRYLYQSKGNILNDLEKNSDDHCKYFLTLQDLIRPYDTQTFFYYLFLFSLKQLKLDPLSKYINKWILSNLRHETIPSILSSFL